jgi:8-oxo-dGTP pyrophosphatase MutT (NUDIX family)
MRVSQAGLACIRRDGPTGPEFLTQWSQKWGMYSLVGGHVEPGETFRECCVREVAEELGLTPGEDYLVSESPLAPTVEYVAMSGGSKVETQYRMELFAVELFTPAAVAKISADPANRWLAVSEIVAERTADGRPISAQVRTNFTLNGVL